MKKILLVPFLFLMLNNGTAQVNGWFKHHSNCKIDDRAEGHVIYSYRIPEDGLYSFIVNGSLLPTHDYYTYNYNYVLELKSATKQYDQDPYNVCTENKDGNICHFSTNNKNNVIAGTFSKNEIVEVRILLLKSEVNGVQHNKLHLDQNTLVYVEKK